MDGWLEIEAPMDEKNAISVWEIAKELSYLKQVLNHLDAVNATAPKANPVATKAILIDFISVIFDIQSRINQKIRNMSVEGPKKEAEDPLSSLRAKDFSCWPSNLKTHHLLIDELTIYCLEVTDKSQLLLHQAALAKMAESLLLAKKECEDEEDLEIHIRQLNEHAQYLENLFVQTIQGFIKNKRERLISRFFRTCEVNPDGIKFKIRAKIIEFTDAVIAKLNNRSQIFHETRLLATRFSRLGAIVKEMFDNIPKGTFDSAEIKENTEKCFNELSASLSDISDLAIHKLPQKASFEGSSKNANALIIAIKKYNKYPLLGQFSDIYNQGCEFISNLASLRDTIAEDIEIQAYLKSCTSIEEKSCPFNKVIAFFLHIQKAKAFYEAEPNSNLLFIDISRCVVGDFLFHKLTGASFNPVFELMTFVSQECIVLEKQFSRLFLEIKEDAKKTSILKDIARIHLPLYMKRCMNFTLSAKELAKHFQNLGQLLTEERVCAIMPKELATNIREETTQVEKLNNFLSQKTKVIDEHRGCDTYIERIRFILDRMAEKLAKTSGGFLQPKLAIIPYSEELIRLLSYFSEIKKQEFTDSHVIFQRVKEIFRGHNIDAIIEAEETMPELTDLLKDLKYRAAACEIGGQVNQAIIENSGI